MRSLLVTLTCGLLLLMGGYAWWLILGHIVFDDPKVGHELPSHEHLEQFPVEHDHPDLMTVELSAKQLKVTKSAAVISSANQEWLGQLERRIIACEMDVEDAHLRITEWHPDK